MPCQMQAEYWRSRTERDGAFVEYGNDVEGSAFSSRDPLGSTRWNLQVQFCLPTLTCSTCQTSKITY